MFLHAPRGLADPVRLAERREMPATVEAVQPLIQWRSDLLARKPGRYVPNFDPAEAGAGAHVLLVLEAPGAMTNATGRRIGSGFVSVDNNDQTAANCWALRDEAGLHRHALLWNAVPWFLGSAAVKPTSAERAEGARELRGLIKHLCDLSVVVLLGHAARQTWRMGVAPYLGSDAPAVVETWHTSTLALKQPGKREEVLAAFQRAAALTG